MGAAPPVGAGEVDGLVDLLVDTESAAGLSVTTVAIVAVALLLRMSLVPLVRRRFRNDGYRRYWSGKVVTYGIATVSPRPGSRSRCRR